jgi:hypothetical protein
VERPEIQPFKADKLSKRAALVGMNANVHLLLQRCKVALDVSVKVIEQLSQKYNRPLVIKWCRQATAGN